MLRTQKNRRGVRERDTFKPPSAGEKEVLLPVLKLKDLIVVTNRGLSSILPSLLTMHSPSKFLQLIIVPSPPLRCGFGYYFLSTSICRSACTRQIIAAATSAPSLLLFPFTAVTDNDAASILIVFSRDFIPLTTSTSDLGTFQNLFPSSAPAHTLLHFQWTV